MSNEFETTKISEAACLLQEGMPFLEAVPHPTDPKGHGTYRFGDPGACRDRVRKFYASMLLTDPYAYVTGYFALTKAMSDAKRAAHVRDS